MNPSPTSSSEIRPSKPQTSVGQVFALVAGFLALAAIGAAIGWSLTDTSGPNPVTAPSVSVSVTSLPPTSPPPPSPSTPPSSSPATGFTLPDYVANQTDFQVARAQLMAAGINGVQITFDPKGVSNGNVTSMDPAAGTVVQKGTTVKLSVEEPAPPLAVPNVMNLSCSDAGHLLARTGFIPNYPNGRTGTVSAQDPGEETDPSNPTHHWYDVVHITCGTPPPPSPSPSPSETPATN